MIRFLVYIGEEGQHSSVSMSLHCGNQEGIEKKLTGQDKSKPSEIQTAGM